MAGATGMFGLLPARRIGTLGLPSPKPLLQWDLRGRSKPCTGNRSGGQWRMLRC